MNTMVLAEMTSNWDISGVFCLASILFLLIAAAAYSTGPWGGSCICLVFFFIALLATGENRSVTGVSPNKMFIANRSQTKVIEKNKYSINDTDCIFFILDRNTSDDITCFIPAVEMYTNAEGLYIMKDTGERPHNYDIVETDILKDRDWSNPNGWVFGDWGNPDDYLYKDDDGNFVKVTTRRTPTDDDYYIWNEAYSPANVSIEAGGWGCPEWLYHPASPTYIFGLAGLPALLGGMFVASKVF